MQSVEWMMHVACSLFLRMDTRKKKCLREYKRTVEKNKKRIRDKGSCLPSAFIFLIYTLNSFIFCAYFRNL